MSNNNNIDYSNETAAEKGERIKIDLSLTYNQAQALLIILSDRQNKEDYKKWHDWIKERLTQIEKILRDKGVYEL